MKKLSTEITTKKGRRKIVFVEVDDDYAKWLLTQSQSVYHDAVLFISNKQLKKPSQNNRLKEKGGTLGGISQKFIIFK